MILAQCYACELHAKSLNFLNLCNYCISRLVLQSNNCIIDLIAQPCMISSTFVGHLDRIDQHDFPLDGEYTIPSDGC